MLKKMFRQWMFKKTNILFTWMEFHWARCTLFLSFRKFSIFSFHLYHFSSKQPLLLQWTTMGKNSPFLHIVRLVVLSKLQFKLKLSHLSHNCFFFFKITKFHFRWSSILHRGVFFQFFSSFFPGFTPTFKILPRGVSYVAMYAHVLSKIARQNQIY